MARRFTEDDFGKPPEDLGEITKVEFSGVLRIEISEPLWFCEKQHVFPNQCGQGHP